MSVCGSLFRSREVYSNDHGEFNINAYHKNLQYIHMTGLLREGIFHVQDLLQPAIFESLPWAYVMCNWAQILVWWRH